MHSLARVVLACLLSVNIAHADSSLTYALSTDNLALTPTTVTRDIGTYTTLMWLYPTSIVSVGRFWQKGDGTTASKRQYWNTGTVGAVAHFGDRTVDVNYLSSKAQGTGRWIFVGCINDTNNPTSGKQLRCFTGTSTETITELAWTTSIDGSGNVAESNATFYVGGAVGAGSDSHRGQIAFFGHWNRALTQNEITDQMFSPHVTSSCTVFMNLGFQGKGTPRDESGQGIIGTQNGTVPSSNGPPISMLMAPIGG